MSLRLIVAMFAAAITAVSCVAQPPSDRKATMILLCYEGMPRAHIPAAVWFEGKTVPIFTADESQHDEYWKQRFATAPKFGLTVDAFATLKSLLGKSRTTKTAYVVEFLYETQRPEVRYLDLEDFERVRDALREAAVKGHEVLADWPTEGK